MSVDEPILPHEPDDPSGGEHLEWRISALLDGELPVAEELVARDHLAGCDLCQDEFAEVMAARALVRGLGEVEPPKGYLERAVARVQRRHQTRLGILGLVTIAVIWIALLGLGVGLGPEAVAPPVDDLVRRHEAAADLDGGPVEDARVLDAHAIAELEAPYHFPLVVGGRYRRAVVLEHPDDVLHGVYRDGEDELSLFQQTGPLDRDGLPPGGADRELGGLELWITERDGLDVVVVAHDDAVFTAVGSGSDELMTVLPEPQPYTLGDRIRQGAEGVLRRLGLD